MLLHTLGDLSLEGSAFRRPKPLLLLAYLALNGPSTRGRLAGLFWRDASDARDSLSTTLRRLAALAPGVIHNEPDRVSTSVRCDAVELLRDAPNALELYRGPFLSGLELRLHEEAEEWLWTTRERLAEHARHLFLGRAAKALAVGETSQARTLAEASLDLEFVQAWQPFEQLELARLLEAVSSGRLPEARRLLKPGSHAGADTGNGNLPSTADAFVGRTAELRQILNLFTSGNARLVTLHGTGGVGKSRLAIEAARSLQSGAELPDGTWFVALEGFGRADELPAAISEALSLPAPVMAPVHSHLLRNIGQRRMLLVLDNFEHLTGATVFLSEMLRTCPHLHVLVTSRQLLNLTQEHVVHIEGLPVETDALSLLRARMIQRAVQTGDSLKSDRAALHICELVDGQPLAIELAAAQTRFRSLQELAGELQHGFGVLVSPDPTVPDRQRSVHMALEVSWHLLSTQDREALARIAIFEGGFSRSAAIHLTVSAATLERLIDAALLKTVNGTGRIRLHPLVREFALKQLRERPELEAFTRLQFALHYLELLRGRAHEAFGGPGSAAFHEMVHDEMANIAAAWKIAVQERWWKLLAEAGFPLGKHSVTRGDYAEYAALLELAVSALKSSGDVEDNNANFARLLSVLAYPTGRLGDNSRAVALCNQALELLNAESFGDAWGVWSARQAGAFALMALQEPEKALRMAEENTRLPLPDNSAESELIWDVATGTSHQVASYLQYQKGNYQAALDHLVEADERMKRHQAPFYTYSFWTMGMILLQLGRHQEARRWLEEGIDYATQVGIRNQQGQLHLELGHCLLGLGERTAATEQARQALSFGLITSDVWLEQEAETLHGLINCEQGNLYPALQHFRKSMELTTGIGIYSLGMRAVIGLGKLLALQGDIQAAVRLLAFVRDSGLAPAPTRDSAAAELTAVQTRLPADTYARNVSLGAALKPAEAFGYQALLDSHRKTDPGITG